MATEQQDALTGVHEHKFKAPTYKRECVTFEERRYKFQIHTGLQNEEHDKQKRQAERATTEEHDKQERQAERARTEEHDRQVRQAEKATTRIANIGLDSRTDTRGSNTMETGLAGDEVHPDKHQNRSSSNSLQTTPAGDWPRHLQTAMPQIRDTDGYKEHWALVTLQNYSNPHLTSTTLNRVSPTGSSSLHAPNEATTQHCLTK